MEYRADLELDVVGAIGRAQRSQDSTVCHSGRSAARCPRFPVLACAKPTLAHGSTCLGTIAPQKVSSVP